MGRCESQWRGLGGTLARSALMLSLGLAAWTCGAAEDPLTLDWNGVVLDRPYLRTNGLPRTATK